MTHTPGASPHTATRTNPLNGASLKCGSDGELGERALHAPSSTPRKTHRTDQLNGTSLKWGSDGELSELDLQRILCLLSQADPVAEALMAHSLEPHD